MARSTQSPQSPRSALAKLRYVAAAGVAVIAFGAAAQSALGGVSGTIAGSPGSAGSAPVQLREGVGAVTCVSTGFGIGPCDAIDDFSAAIDQTPGGAPSTTTVTLQNTGSTDAAAASLAAGVCGASAARDDEGFRGDGANGFCDKVDVTIANLTPGAPYPCIFPVRSVASCPAPDARGTLAGLSGRTLMSPALSPLAAGATATYLITLRLDASASNADQGLTASLPLTWTINQ